MFKNLVNRGKETEYLLLSTLRFQLHFMFSMRLSNTKITINTNRIVNTMTRIIASFFFRIKHNVKHFHHNQVSGRTKANANFGVDKTWQESGQNMAGGVDKTWQAKWTKHDKNITVEMWKCEVWKMNASVKLIVKRENLTSVVSHLTKECDYFYLTRHWYLSMNTHRSIKV